MWLILEFILWCRSAQIVDTQPSKAGTSVWYHWDWVNTLPKRSTDWYLIWIDWTRWLYGIACKNKTVGISTGDVVCKTFNVVGDEETFEVKLRTNSSPIMANNNISWIHTKLYKSSFGNVQFYYRALGQWKSLLLFQKIILHYIFKYI